MYSGFVFAGSQFSSVWLYSPERWRCAARDAVSVMGKDLTGPGVLNAGPVNIDQTARESEVPRSYSA